MCAPGTRWSACQRHCQKECRVPLYAPKFCDRRCTPGCVCDDILMWLHADGTCTSTCESYQVVGGPVFTSGKSAILQSLKQTPVVQSDYDDEGEDEENKICMLIFCEFKFGFCKNVL